MAKNALAVKKTKTFRDITSILNNPKDRAKLQSYIDEVVRCKTKILDEQESIRGLRDSAVEELSIEPKLFSALVSLFFNNNFDQKKEEISKLEAAIEALQSNPALPE